jgi:hypothetical protein
MQNYQSTGQHHPMILNHLLTQMEEAGYKFCSAYEVGKLCEYVGSLAGECLIALKEIGTGFRFDKATSWS